MRASTAAASKLLRASSARSAARSFAWSPSWEEAVDAKGDATWSCGPGRRASRRCLRERASGASGDRRRARACRGECAICDRDYMLRRGCQCCRDYIGTR